MTNYPDQDPVQLEPDRSTNMDEQPLAESQAVDDPEEIRAEIVLTRAEMGDTLSAIQERLDPERLKEEIKEQVHDQVEQVKGQVRDATIGKAEHVMSMVDYTAREASYTLLDRVRANPIPAALVGVGIAWMFMSGSNPSRRDFNQPGYGRRSDDSMDRYPNRYSRSGYGSGDGRYGDRDDTDAGHADIAQTARQGVGNVGDRIGDQVGQIGDHVQGQVQQAGGQVRHLGNQVQERVSGIGDQVQGQVQDYTDTFQDTFAQAQETLDRSLRENPLAAGTVALAVGAAIGMILPETPQENQVLGGAREQVVQKAQSVAGEALQNVQQTVQQTAKPGQ